jgi:hypothetical protein
MLGSPGLGAIAHRGRRQKISAPGPRNTLSLPPMSMAIGFSPSTAIGSSTGGHLLSPLAAKFLPTRSGLATVGAEPSPRVCGG